MLYRRPRALSRAGSEIVHAVPGAEFCPPPGHQAEPVIHLTASIMAAGLALPCPAISSAVP